MILLSFDIEEFDMPFEYGKSLSFEEQISISVTGTQIILDLLRKLEIKATFFCTANFANHAEHLVKRMVEEGHEVASHGYFHSEFKVDHLKQSKEKLEQITGHSVTGFRMPRMMPVDTDEIFLAGYQYNTSNNPTWLPGRYNNLKKPRTWFIENDIIQIPSSVSPLFRIPLFWLSFHNLPLGFYQTLCKRTYYADYYLNLYFHPWEFTDLGPKEKYNLPWYVVKNSGGKMTFRLEMLIRWMKEMNYPFTTFKTFIQSTLQKDSR